MVPCSHAEWLMWKEISMKRVWLSQWKVSFSTFGHAKLLSPLSYPIDDSAGNNLPIVLPGLHTLDARLTVAKNGVVHINSCEWWWFAVTGVHSWPFSHAVVDTELTWHLLWHNYLASHLLVKTSWQYLFSTTTFWHILLDTNCLYGIQWVAFLCWYNSFFLA